MARLLLARLEIFKGLAKSDFLFLYCYLEFKKIKMIWYGEQKDESTEPTTEKLEFLNQECSTTVQMRFLTPDDISEVRALCEDFFPILYPSQWYEDITSNSSKFYSLCATFNSAIVGLLVAEIKLWHKLNKEDRTILSESLGKNSSLAYILSIGVHRKYRRNGIATTLLQTFMEHLQNSEQNSKIKAIYLHVLTTNHAAISFYERHKYTTSSYRSKYLTTDMSVRFSFTLHSFLPYYYSIKGKSRDGFCYVTYINGGTFPLTFVEKIRDSVYNLFKLNFCSWLVKKSRNLVNWLSYYTFSKIHYFRQ